jgi:hypothetical protein
MPIISISAFITQSVLAHAWRPVRGGSLYGISGMVVLNQQTDAVELLVVHDNKQPDQYRLGRVTIQGDEQPGYVPLRWPQNNLGMPVDLEALTAVPGQPGTYMAATSLGKVYHFRFDRTRNAIAVLAVFDLPGLAPGSNLEGFSLTQIDGELVAVWAHRGEGLQPARLYWGTLNLHPDRPLLLGATNLKVPLAVPQVRHIADLKVDSAGVVYITAASDRGDDGPFQSAVYVAGVIGRCDKTFSFRQPLQLVPLYRERYHKIEAIELLPGTTGGVVLATDDEAMGGSILIAGDE